MGRGDVQNIRLQRRRRPTGVTTDQWRHSQIRILSSSVIISVRKRRRQTMTFRRRRGAVKIISKSIMRFINVHFGYYYSAQIIKIG